MKNNLLEHGAIPKGQRVKPERCGRRRWLDGIAIGVLLACLSTSAGADDIDVYTAKIAAQRKPNILFVLDYSGSMGWDINGTRNTSASNPARLTILKNAMADLLERNFDRINAGIGSLYSSTTTGIRWPISELNADANTVDPIIPAGQFTVRDVILNQVNERGAGGSTATIDALVEAAQYFRGDPVTHNDSPTWDSTRFQPDQWSTTENLYTGGNGSAALANTYSPENAFTTNTVGTFYCNDYSISGGPDFCENFFTSNCTNRTIDDDVTEGYARLTNLWGNYRRCEYQRNGVRWIQPRYNSPITQVCQSNTIVLISDGVPWALNDGASLQSIVGTTESGCEDLSSSVFNRAAGTRRQGNCGIEVLQALSQGDVNPDIPGSDVRTFTVGFNINGTGQNFLRRLAAAGNGEFYQANQPEELSEALNSILDEVLGGSENFSELSIDVDKASFSHDNRAFFSLFSPSTRQSWTGNLKGYFIEPEGIVDINGEPAVVSGIEGLTFADGAQSFWSSSSDGNDVATGGASEQLLSGSRNLYTYTGDAVPDNGVSLRGDTTNLLDASNNTITPELLGLPADTGDRTRVLDWIQTAPMGDPLHTKSVTVNYGTRQVVFISTNQGLLHAIDATSPTSPGTGDSSGGDEIFAFMPKRLLANLPDLEANTNQLGHIYGLDGAITRWHDDSDNDGVVDTGESVLLIVGMRRGGSAYYALDVSNPDFPRLQWVIDETNEDFPELAQSWSRMSLITVKKGGSNKQLLAFAAGFDAAAQDDQPQAVASRGNAIYMVDDKGKLVWTVNSQNHAAMLYSIPSDLTIIDSDGDQVADRLYVGDMAGQVWRVDFPDVQTTADVTLLAKLDDGDHQPVFYPPSVALNLNSDGSFLSVAVGTGNRTDPLLEGINNNIYMLKDTDLKKGPPSSDFRTITPTMLYDATNNNIESPDSETAADASEELKAARGWKVALRSSEKALSSLVTFEGKILATTFEAEPDNMEDDCGFETTGRFYAMSVDDAKPIRFIDSTNENPSSFPVERGEILGGDGIPSSPVVVFSQDTGVVQVVVDKETVGRFAQAINSVFWHAR